MTTINSSKDDSIHTICCENDGSENQKIQVYSPQRYSLLAIQNIISALPNLLYFPVALLTPLCLLRYETTIRDQIIFNLLFCSGVATILQAAVGIKFPVLISPSNLFISGSILFLKSPYWEQYSNADLYTMGPSHRHEEFTCRTREIRGIMILSGCVCSVVCGILWHLPIKLPSATISATLISFCLSNVSQILGEKEISLFTILVFSLSLVFYCFKSIKVSFSDKINTDGFYVTFKQFSVLLSSIICLAIHSNFENENQGLLDRAVASHQWYSLRLPFKDFVLPKFSTKSLLLLPAFCSQFIISYCCFRAICKEKKIYLKALLLETVFIIVTAAIGVVVPLTIDPTSIALLQITKVEHSESSLIAGGLLVLFSIVIKILALLSHVPYPILCGINLFLYGQLLGKGLEQMNSDETESSVIAMSVLCGLVLQVFSSVPIEIESSMVYSMTVLIIKSPILVTFVMSVMLSLAFKTFNKK